MNIHIDADGNQWQTGVASSTPAPTTFRNKTCGECAWLSDDSICRRIWKYIDSLEAACPAFIAKEES